MSVRMHFVSKFPRHYVARESWSRIQCLYGYVSYGFTSNQSNKPYVRRKGDSILESEQLVGRMRLNTCQEFP